MKIVNFDNDVCALTDKGLVRSHNEDSNRVEETRNGSLFVVCDGMGGHVGGATASRIGVDSVCEYVMNSECALPGQFLENALQYANKKIFEKACSDPGLKGMGTTGCVALVREDTVWYAHVGDSRIYYYNAKRQTLYRLSKDHSLVQSMVDRGEISEFQAEHHPDKNKILRSLGIKNTVVPEPCEKPLKPADGDILLICSDGLSGMMEEKDMLEVLVSTKDLNEAGKILVDLAKVGGGTDNITVQLVRFSNTGRSDADFLPKNAGVSVHSGKNHTGKKSKRVWPWIVIVLSAMMVGVGVALRMTNKTKQQEPVVQTVVQVDDTPAYLKVIPQGVNPIKYMWNGAACEFYATKKLSNDKCEGVSVNVDEQSYSIGTFEKLPNNKGYRPIQVERFKKNGEKDE